VGQIIQPSTNSGLLCTCAKVWGGQAAQPNTVQMAFAGSFAADERHLKCTPRDHHVDIAMCLMQPAGAG
jgi:hypothetical protein